MASSGVTYLSIVVYVLVYLLLISSCKEAPNKDVVEDAQKIAKLKCSSRKLTEEKFILASRYTEIEQLKVENKITSDSLAKIKVRLDKEKAVLIQKSQDKSDELLLFLRGVWQEKYLTQADRAMLDSITELELRKVCKMP